ncbi:MAG: DUF4358 domain-containing protein [Oscillospiraceae bacterium]|nr:DUF4358 domain-containing protein [Oscillospiraceae bacterium]
MKRIFCIMLALVMLLTACQSKPTPNTIIDDKPLSDVMETVRTNFDAKYGENGASIVNMAGDIEPMYLSDMCGIPAESIAESYGWISMSMTNSDTFFVVKAAEGKSEEVKTAMENRLQALIDQYEFYPVNGSYDRAKAGKVHVLGDYVFLIVVGVDPEKPEEFDSQVQFVVDEIDKQFNH